MGFYNILFEGQQADKYLADKVRAEKAKEKEELERAERRYGHTIDGHPIGAKYDSQNNPNRSFTSKKQRQKDEDRSINSMLVFNRKIDQEYENEDYRRMENIDPVLRRKAENEDYTPTRKEVIKQNHQAGAYDDTDAINRHMRRHPDQWDGDKRIKIRSESGIFESVEFLND